MKHKLIARYNENHRLWELVLRGGGQQKSLGYFKTEENAKIAAWGYEQGVADAKLALGRVL
jgi:hypothetical protein